ncbi:MAG: HAD-IIIA family hydrolase, partial [Patescibacteria group bacterium]
MTDIRNTAQAWSGIRQAVILAGGMGVRLQPFTYDRPKPMVEVNGLPFVDYLIDELKKNGIHEVVFLLGYLPEKIQEYFGDGKKHGLRVRYSVTPVEDATGTRIRKAKDLLHERFLLMYCDNFIHLNLGKLQEFHVQKNALMTQVVYTNQYGFTKNNILVDNDGYVLVYDKPRTKPNLNGVDLGFFIVEKEILARMPERDFWIYELFPGLIAERKLAGFTTAQLYYSLSTPERMKLTERFFMPRKVIFLDRDGVINKKMPKGDYVKNWSEFKFLPGVQDAFKLLKDHGYEVYIISNQAGIGKGFMSEGDLFEIHKNMEKEIKAHGG